MTKRWKWTNSRNSIGLSRIIVFTPQEICWNFWSQDTVPEAEKNAGMTVRFGFSHLAKKKTIWGQHIVANNKKIARILCALPGAVSHLDLLGERQNKGDTAVKKSLLVLFHLNKARPSNKIMNISQCS